MAEGFPYIKVHDAPVAVHDKPFMIRKCKFPQANEPMNNCLSV